VRFVAEVRQAFQVAQIASGAQAKSCFEETGGKLQAQKGNIKRGSNCNLASGSERGGWGRGVGGGGSDNNRGCKAYSSALGSGGTYLEDIDLP